MDRAESSIRATPEEIAWAAGLFEGEGSVTSRLGTATSKKHRYRPSVRIEMTDEDIVLRFGDIINRATGSRRSSYMRSQAAPSRNPKWKPTYIMTYEGYEPVSRIYKLFKPWLGPRRMAQFKKALTNWETRPVFRPLGAHRRVPGQSAFFD